MHHSESAWSRAASSSSIGRLWSFWTFLAVCAAEEQRRVGIVLFQLPNIAILVGGSPDVQSILIGERTSDVPLGS